MRETEIARENANNAKLQSFATLSEFYQVRVSAEQQFPVARDAPTRKTYSHTRKKCHREDQFRRLHNEEVVGYWYQWDRYRVYVRATRPRPISFMSSRFHELFLALSIDTNTCGYTYVHTHLSRNPRSFPTSDLSCRSHLRPG